RRRLAELLDQLRRSDRADAVLDPLAPPLRLRGGIGRLRGHGRGEREDERDRERLHVFFFSSQCSARSIAASSRLSTQPRSTAGRMPTSSSSPVASVAVGSSSTGVSSSSPTSTTSPPIHSVVASGAGASTAASGAIARLSG